MLFVERSTTFIPHERKGKVCHWRPLVLPFTFYRVPLSQMSNKITDSRVKELESLERLKEELKEKIQEKKDKMKEIRDAMKRGDTADVILSSSTAALKRQGKEAFNLTNDDLLDVLDIAVKRLEEQFSKVDEELNNLKKLMGSS